MAKIPIYSYDDLRKKADDIVHLRHMFLRAGSMILFEFSTLRGHVLDRWHI